MLTKITPSYLYQQYADDDDLQALVRAQNELAQSYLDWFNQTPLAVYTGQNVYGELLDWVAQGRYGLKRPSLSVATSTVDGKPSYVASDDVFKRCLTWNLYRGDGNIFNVRWLKRRVKRFLDGVNGVDPPVRNTDNIRVTFGAGNLVNIIITGGTTVVHPTSVPNARPINTWVPNQGNVTYTSALGDLLRAVIQCGAVQLPFQYTYEVYG